MNTRKIQPHVTILFMPNLRAGRCGTLPGAALAAPVCCEERESVQQNGRGEERRSEVRSWKSDTGTPPSPLPFFWKCVKRKGFKSFVLKVCESKGFAGAFL